MAVENALFDKSAPYPDFKNIRGLSASLTLANHSIPWRVQGRRRWAKNSNQRTVDASYDPITQPSAEGNQESARLRIESTPTGQGNDGGALKRIPLSISEVGAC